MPELNAEGRIFKGPKADAFPAKVFASVPGGTDFALLTRQLRGSSGVEYHVSVLRIDVPVGDEFLVLGENTPCFDSFSVANLY